MVRAKNKEQLKLKWLRPSYFLILAIIFSALSVWALRANNLHMLSLKKAVYSADKDNNDVQGALQRLQAFVTTHMNTDLSSGPNAVHPAIQLEYSYQRAKSAISVQTNQIYNDARNYCEPNTPHGVSDAAARPCINHYLATHKAEAMVPDSLYKFDFASPTWSPDLAGWSIVAAILSALLFPVTWIIKKLVN